MSVGRPGARLGLGLLLGALAVALGDDGVFTYRLSRGSAHGTVRVRQYLATPPKNRRDELDYLGEVDQPCVRALLPHTQLAPCWWVRRHKDQWTQS